MVQRHSGRATVEACGKENTVMKVVDRSDMVPKQSLKNAGEVPV